MNRVLRWALRLFPRSFRERYEDELYEALLLKTRDVRERYGQMGVVRMWLFQGFDLLRSARSEQASERSRTRHPTAPSESSLSRRMKGDPVLATVWQDVRSALRTLRRRATFTAVAVATLGLGIGSSTAMFSVLYHVLLYPSPFRDPGQLVTVFQALPWLQETEGRGVYWDRNPMQLQQYQALRESTTRFQDVAVHRTWEMTLTGLGEPRREMVGVASASLFPTLGVRLALGRSFLPEEESFTEGGGAQVAILSHEMWRTSFAADREVVGRTIVLDNRPRMIVGVLPPGFRLRWLGSPGTDAVDTGRKRIHRVWPLPSSSSSEPPASFFSWPAPTWPCCSWGRWWCAGGRLLPEPHWEPEPAGSLGSF